MKYANLHLHSTHSDAGFRPAHLVYLAKSLGYGALALTDHEAISGLPELFAAAKREGIEAMSGVELYASIPDGPTVHVTGLDFDYTHPAIVDFTDFMTEKRNEFTRKQFEIAVELGLLPKVTWDDIVKYNPGSKWFCNDQVYFALDVMGLLPFVEGKATFREVFHSEAARSVKIYMPTLAEVISAIRDAGGVPVLAHPPKGVHKHLQKAVDLGLRGIEICHPDLSEEETKLAIHSALTYNLYCSGGTDHTGPMSACEGELAIPAYHGATYDEFMAIKERRLG